MIETMTIEKAAPMIKKGTLFVAKTVHAVAPMDAHYLYTATGPAKFFEPCGFWKTGHYEVPCKFKVSINTECGETVNLSPDGEILFVERV